MRLTLLIVSHRFLGSALFIHLILSIYFSLTLFLVLIHWMLLLFSKKNLNFLHNYIHFIWWPVVGFHIDNVSWQICILLWNEIVSKWIAILCFSIICFLAVILLVIALSCLGRLLYAVSLKNFLHSCIFVINFTTLIFLWDTPTLLMFSLIGTSVVIVINNQYVWG